MKSSNKDIGRNQVFAVLFQYIKPHLIFFILSTITVIVSAINILIFGQGLRKLIDSGIDLNSEQIINSSLVFLLIVVAIMAATSFLRICLTGYGSEKIIFNIRKDIFNHLISLPPGFFHNISISSITSILVTDTITLQSILSRAMSIILRNFTILFGSIIMLFHTDMKLTSYIAVIIPFLLLIVSLLGKKVRMLSRIANDQTRNIASFSEEIFREILTVQSFLREKLEKKRFMDLLQQTLLATNKYNYFRALLVTLIITSIMSAVSFVLWLGIREVIIGEMTAGSLSSFIFYAALAAGAINNIGDNVNDIQKIFRIMERIISFISIKSDIIEQENSITVSEFKNNIVISNVVFFYPSRMQQPVLNDVSFSIKKGEIIVIVGPSGAGKSTIFNLLMRFYDPNEGNITIDGIDIKSMSLKDVRSLFGFVSQHPTIFSGTILDNIKYGNINASYEQVVEAARIARALDFIENLQDKFDTFVGERGLCLSEGQKQRLAIARVILKDPQILILDEVTSALDVENERLIYQALAEISINKTIIIIAHRFSTVLKADRVIVMNNSKIEEMGSHKYLMNKGGLYAKLAKLQLYKG